MAVAAPPDLLRAARGRPRARARRGCWRASTPRAGGGASSSPTRRSSAEHVFLHHHAADRAARTTSAGWPTSCAPASARTGAGRSGTTARRTCRPRWRPTTRCASPACPPTTRPWRARGTWSAAWAAPTATRFFTRLWLAVHGAVPVVGAAGHAARDDLAAAARAALALPLRLLGARHVRRPDGGALAPPHLPAAGGARRAVPASRRASGPPPRAKAPGPWTPWFRAGHAAGRAPTTAGPCARVRRRGRGRIARWICDRQEADGSWGGIQPPWIYSIIALHALGYPLDHPVIAKGLGGLRRHLPRRGRRAPAHAGLPLPRLGHVAWPRSRWATPACPPSDPALARAARVAAGQGGHPVRRLVGDPAPRAPGRLVVRVRERLVPGHRRHGRGAPRPAAGRAAARGPPGRAARRRLAAGDAEPATAAGARSTSTTTGAS